MRENELSLFSKAAIVVLLAVSTLSAILNIAHGSVANPRAFSLAVIGIALFLAAKISVVARGRWVSFGTWPMSGDMANVYRLGYWLMALGILLTFA